MRYDSVSIHPTLFCFIFNPKTWNKKVKKSQSFEGLSLFLFWCMCYTLLKMMPFERIHMFNEILINITLVMNVQQSNSTSSNYRFWRMNEVYIQYMHQIECPIMEPCFCIDNRIWWDWNGYFNQHKNTKNSSMEDRTVAHCGVSFKFKALEHMLK